MTGKDKTLKILFFGDVVGKPGRYAVRDFLSESKDEYDFVIANVENASHGFGLTEKNYNEFIEYGVDAMTCGNHIWDKKDILAYIDNAEKLVRPINYPKSTKGLGSRVFEKNGVKIGVINVLGRVFMPLCDSPWEIISAEIKRIREITPVVVVDFHAEATAEKVCFGKYCSEFGVSAFWGTHTHVQTADESIINNMAYITDAGFCGASDGVIGMDYETSLSRFLTCVPERYEVAKGESVQTNAVEVEVEVSTGRALSVKRIFCMEDKIEKEAESEEED